MASMKDKIAYSALGVSGGLAGASAMTACAGSACASCFGCVGAGVVLGLAVLINRARKAVTRRSNAST